MVEEPMAVEGGELTDPLFTLSPPWPGGPGVHHPPPPPQVRPRPPGGHRPLRSQGTKVFHHPLLSLSSAISHPQAPGVRDDGSKVHGGHRWRGEPETNNFTTITTTTNFTTTRGSTITREWWSTARRGTASAAWCWSPWTWCRTAGGSRVTPAPFHPYILLPSILRSLIPSTEGLNSSFPPYSTPQLLTWNPAPSSLPVMVLRKPSGGLSASTRRCMATCATAKTTPFIGSCSVIT